MAQLKGNPFYDQLPPFGEILAKTAGPSKDQEAGKLTAAKKMTDTRFSPQRRGKHEVGSGKLHRKGFKK